ncbi:hypothetical protein PVK06_020519 [Gossypium arboreum]|uniref:Uncharacterized protein n=1 Tax=Gossypium arboreum TaxID=29729 RepID=A0ABR0PMK2_GOSAR|nr:hypothetical protein PVK06_020519 [Gossypium arboreum]
MLQQQFRILKKHQKGWPLILATLKRKWLSFEVYQLIDYLTKSDTDDEEEVPINQLNRKRYKQTTRKSVQDDAGEMERQQRYKRVAKKFTQPK